MDTSAEQLIPPTNQQNIEHDPNAETVQTENGTKPETQDQSPEAVIAHTPASGESETKEKTAQESVTTDSTVINVQPQEYTQNGGRLQESNKIPSLTSSITSSSTSSSSSMSSTYSESSTPCCTCSPLKSCCVRCKNCLRLCMCGSNHARVRVAKYLIVPYILLAAIPISAIDLSMPKSVKCPLITKTSIDITIFATALLASICLIGKVVELMLECITRRPRYYFPRGLEVVFFLIVSMQLVIVSRSFERLPRRSSNPKSDHYCDLWYYTYIKWLNLGSIIVIAIMGAGYVMVKVWLHANDLFEPRVINTNQAQVDAPTARIEV